MAAQKDYQKYLTKKRNEKRIKSGGPSNAVRRIRKFAEK